MIREQRAVLRHRAQLVRLRTLLRNRIHAVLADYGCDRMGRAGNCWSTPGRAWLGELPLPDSARRAVTDRLEVIDTLQQVIDRLDAELAQVAKADPRVKALTALPGIGPLTALVITAEIGDITRFSWARKLASWAGLTPTVRGSDRTVRYGHISKQGDPWLRWIMNQAAQTAKRTEPYAARFEQIAHRRGRKIATTAVARKLLTHAYHVLRELDAAQQPKEPRTTA